MIRRSRLVFGWMLLAALAPGCTEEVSPPPSDSMIDDTPTEDKEAILKSVIRLIRDAATNPGGKNFDVATENLNAYFGDFKAEEFAIPDAQLDFLKSQMAPDALRTISDRQFSQRDGRHIEDQLLLHSVAARIAGEGDDLTRARRLFDYVVRHAMLVPPGSLAPPGVAQAQARPYDVLLRAMATEDGTGWSERGWLFMVLCRQIGLDCGVITYTPPAVPPGPVPPSRSFVPAQKALAFANAAPQPEPRFWAVAVLYNGKPYLFDPGIGLPIPSADGKGVATLDEAVSDPRVLAQLDLPGDEYEPSRATAAASTFRVLLESNLGTLSTKMKLLQAKLSAENRMVLYRDPVEQVAAFKKAIGPRCEYVGLWRLPMSVEYRLFNPGPGNFIEATLYPLQFFVAKWPLLAARLRQLRGETADAIQSYVVLRFAESPMDVEGKERIPPQVQMVFDVFATYFLGLSQMEKGSRKEAKDMFARTLEMIPEPGPRAPYFFMFRWGAMTNLGLLNAEDGNRALAVRYLAQQVPTLQMRGNLIRARGLIFKDPFVPPKDTPKVIPPLAPRGASNPAS